MKAGVVEFFKLTRGILRSPSSITSLILTTEALIADKPEKASAPAHGGYPTDYDM